MDQQVTKSKVNIFQYLVLGAKVLGCALFLTAAFYAIYSFAPKKTVSVTGYASSTVINQIARFTANVTTKDADKAKAVQSITDKSNKVVDEIKKFGIDYKDIKTTNMSVYQLQEPYYEGGYTQYKPGDWQAMLSVEVVVRDMEKSSEFASLLANLDTSDVYGPNLMLDDKKIDDTDLIAEAMADARRKAEILAEKSGGKLGRVVSVVESYSSYTPYYPMYSAKVGMGGGDASLPIEPGTSDTSKSLMVVFEVR